MAFYRRLQKHSQTGKIMWKSAWREMQKLQKSIPRTHLAMRDSRYSVTAPYYNSSYSVSQFKDKFARSEYFAQNTTGVIAAQIRLENLLEGVEGMMEKFTFDAARQLYFKIQERVPYDTGRLAASVRVDRMGQNSVVGFEAYAFAVNPETGEEYAVIQHEEERYRHAPGRTHHYISIPFEEVVDDLEKQLIQNSMKIAQILYHPDAAPGKHNALFQHGWELYKYGEDTWGERAKKAKRIPHWKDTIDFDAPNMDNYGKLAKIAEDLGIRARWRRKPTIKQDAIEDLYRNLTHPDPIIRKYSSDRLEKLLGMENLEPGVIRSKRTSRSSSSRDDLPGYMSNRSKKHTRYYRYDD